MPANHPKPSRGTGFSLCSVLAIALLLGATGLMAQTATELEAPAVNRVAEKLQCPCGCKMNMACRMDPYPCQVCRKNKVEIYDLQQAGKTDRQILDQFVTEQGKDILIEPPGIMGVGGIAIAAAIGFGIVLLVIRHSLHKPAALRTAGAAGPQMDPETIAKIDEDLDKLD